jgi:DNA-binding NtrC family response regulator
MQPTDDVQAPRHQQIAPPGQEGGRCVRGPYRALVERLPIATQVVKLTGDRRSLARRSRRASATRREEALKLCRGHEGRIDLLLTDVVMPRMGGRELSERVTAERPGMRTLFMSGYTDVFRAENGVLPPDSGFIQKPFSAAALAQHLRALLDATPGRTGGRAA